jgi:hypothetical protein
MNSLNLILQNRPPWVEIEDKRNNGANILASPPAAGGRAAHTFRLNVRSSKQGGLAVKEQPEHRQLPTFCLERHINPDGTFCLYFNSGAQLNDADAAISWWSSLGTFLSNQLYAEKRSVWPLEAGLSHGDAAREQLAMEELAAPLGWKDDIWRAMFRGRGWMAEQLPRVSKQIDRVLNARAPCPRGCTWKHRLLRQKSCVSATCYSDCGKKHKPVPRAQCPNRYLVEALVLREHRRQKIEAEIVNKLVQEGKRCCGTMKRCPLRKDGGHGSAE